MERTLSTIPTDLLEVIETIFNTHDGATEFDFQCDRIPSRKLIYGLVPVGVKLSQSPQVPIEHPTKQGDLVYIQCVMKSLTNDGEAGVIVPHGFMFRDGLNKLIRNQLFTDFNIHTILSLPNGFLPMAGIKSEVLFFNRQPSVGTWVWRQEPSNHDLSQFIEFMSIPHKSRHENHLPLTTYISQESIRKYVVDDIDPKIKLLFDVY